MPADHAYDRCTATTYAPANTSANLVGLVRQPRRTRSPAPASPKAPASCPSRLDTAAAPAGVNRPDQVVSATRTFYDDTSFATTFPQSSADQGRVTMTRTATDYGTRGVHLAHHRAEHLRQHLPPPRRSPANGNGNTTTTGYR